MSKHKKDAQYRRVRRKSKCEGCGVGDDEYYQVGVGSFVRGLSTHHLLPVSQGGHAKDGIVTLCDNCHKDIHTVDGKFNWKHVNPELTEYYLSKL